VLRAAVGSTLYLALVALLSLGAATIIRDVPLNAGLTIQDTTNLHGLPISPWAGLGVLAAWTAAALLTGGLLLRKRDA